MGNSGSKHTASSSSGGSHQVHMPGRKFKGSGHSLSANNNSATAAASTSTPTDNTKASAPEPSASRPLRENTAQSEARAKAAEAAAARFEKQNSSKGALNKKLNQQRGKTGTQVRKEAAEENNRMRDQPLVYD